MRVVASLAVGLFLLGPLGASAQRVSLAADSFLQDVNSLAGVSRIGAALLAADPVKKRWGEYCSASQALAQRGEFRQAIRTAAKALYLGESVNATGGAAIIFSSNDIANAYSYAGDGVTARAWADRTLAAIAGGYDNSAFRDVQLIRANSHRIRALALSVEGQGAAAIAEIGKAMEGLPLGRSFVKSELQLAQASIWIAAGEPLKAGDIAQRLVDDPDPLIRFGAMRLAGEAALAGRNAPVAKSFFHQALAAASGKDAHQAVMARVGLARALRLSREDDAASGELVEALASLENLRGSFRSFEMRTALSGSLQGVYDEAVDFFASRGEAAKALAASEASRARAMLDLQSKIEGGGIAKAAHPRPLDEIQARLGADQALVVYHQLPARLVSWVVTRDGLQLHVVPVGAVAMREAVTRFRKAIESESTDTVQQAQALHLQLLAGLKLLPGKKLVFVPHRSLHLLPFQALHDGQRWMIESSSVATAMSASLLDVSSAIGNSRLSAIGNPDLGRAEWALPGAEREVTALAGLYAQPSVAIQKEASRARLEAMVPNAQVVHVAAHAVIDEVDPMYSVIKLAVTAGKEGSALAMASDLEARELARLDLSSSTLVSLSACSSGLGKVAQGDEFMGFKRALFAAGARSVLVSLWPVDDDATEMLMTDFHKGWKSASRADAMRSAQINLLKQAKYANPYFWAPFTLVGDPG
jgi:CHAT domain-containing protein